MKLRKLFVPIIFFLAQERSIANEFSDRVSKEIIIGSCQILCGSQGILCTHPDVKKFCMGTCKKESVLKGLEKCDDQTEDINAAKAHFQDTFCHNLCGSVSCSNEKIYMLCAHKICQNSGVIQHCLKTGQLKGFDKKAPPKAQQQK